MNLEKADSKDFKTKWFDFVGYKPHEGQLRLHYPEKESRFTVAVCGRRWGKSKSASIEAQIILAQPNKRVWIVAPTYDLSEKIFREIWNTLLIEKGFATKRASYKDQIIEFEWGSVVQGKSADKPDSLVGESLDYVILDEAAKIKRKIWSAYLRPALSDKRGKALFISTPEGFNHLFDLYQIGQTDPMWHSFRSPSWENPYAFPGGHDDEDLLEAKRNMDKEIFDQEMGATFTALSGRVYPFDRNLDMGDYPYDPNLPTFGSIDFGFRMPSFGVFQVYRIDGKWHINMIDEISHETNMKTDVFVNRIKAMPYEFRAFYGAPAGHQRQSQSCIGDAEIFRQKGIFVRSKRDRLSRSIDSGISLVRSYIENAEGERFFHVDNKCTGMAEDLESYRYPEIKDSKPLKAEPLKDGRSDHGCDMLRYFIVNHFGYNKKLKVRKR